MNDRSSSSTWRLCTIQTLIDENFIIGHLDGNHGELYPTSEEFASEGVPYISANNFESGEVDLRSCKKIPLSRAILFKKGISKSGDVLFAHNATVGPVALLNCECEFVILSTTATYFRCNLDKLWNKYLLYSLQSQPFVRQYSTIMGQSTRNQVPITAQRKLYVQIPSIVEQKAIAVVLGLVDAAIFKARELIAQMELRKKGMLRQLLTGKKRLQGFHGHWQKRSYSALLKTVKRKSDWNDEELYPLLSVRRRSGGCFLRESLFGKQIQVKDLRTALEGDFLFSKMQIVHGASALVTKEFSGTKISGSYIAVISNDSVVLDIRFFNLHSMTPRFYHQTYISSFGVHIEKMTFDFDSFLSLEMLVPPLDEQKAIVEFIQLIDREILLLKIKAEKLREEKKGLMQVILTGKTRLKEFRT